MTSEPYDFSSDVWVDFFIFLIYVVLLNRIDYANIIPMRTTARIFIAQPIENATKNLFFINDLFINRIILPNFEYV